MTAREGRGVIPKDLGFLGAWLWRLRRRLRLSREYLADAAVVAAGVSGQSFDLHRRVSMLTQGPVPTEPRGPRRGSLLAALGLFALAVLVLGFGPSTPAIQAQGKAVEEPKKDDSPKEKGKKEEPAEEEDPQLTEMLKRLPPNTPPEMRARMREHFAQILKQRRAIGAGGFPTVPNIGMPGFSPFGGGMMEPRLGARLSQPSATLVDQLDLPRGQGLVLEDVPARSAAAKAGLKAHDILLELDGKVVSNRMEELSRTLRGIKPNKAVEAVVMRKGKKETIKDLSLPEARIPGLPPGFNPPDGFPPPGGNPPGGLPNRFAPPGGNPPGGDAFNPFAPPGGNTVMTTTYRTDDRFTTRHQEGSLVITITGKVEDGKAALREIRVQDGRETETYTSADKVPERYRDKVKGLLQTLENGPKVEIKSREPSGK